MTVGQESIPLPTPSEERSAERDLKDRGDAPTPVGLIWAVLRTAMAYYMTVSSRSSTESVLIVMPGCRKITVSEEHPFKLLDVCCGYGAWAMVFAAYWVHVLKLPREWLRITGLEIHEPRRVHLKKWCDDFRIGDYRLALESCSGFDMIIGNPDFEILIDDDVEQSMPAVLMRHSPAVLLLHTRNAFVRNDNGRAVWRQNSPVATWSVPGTVSFNGTSSRAPDCYDVSMWLRGHHESTQYNLIDTEPEQWNREAGILKRNNEPYKCWRWIIPPGTEEPSADFPSAPGWRSAEAGL